MTEPEWLVATDPAQMLEGVRGHVTQRKLWLLAVLCGRRVKLLTDVAECVQAIDMAEAHAEGQASIADLEAAITRARERFPLELPANWTAGVIATAPDMVAAQALNLIVNLTGIVVPLPEAADLAPGGVASTARQAAFQASESQRWAAISETRRELAGLLRHLIGNPFHHYPMSGGWPSTVTHLAQALYNGEDCRLPLSDAIEEAGHEKLAQHFRAEQWHPKGCWSVDLILGKG